jgi:hypothetical protein
VQAEEQDWFEYIDGEVRAVCEAEGWGHQIRQKWSVREKPVSESTIDDYEWKLIPGARGRLPDAPSGDFEGVYYVLSVEKSSGRFVLQHDTSHCGMRGPHWEVATYTEISLDPWVTPATPEEYKARRGYPPVGWLRDHLRRLTTAFRPNTFSVT